MIACIHQGANETCGVLAAYTIDVGNLAPAMDGARVVMLSFGFLCETFQRTRIAALEARTLGVHPLLELRNVTEIEAVEKFPAVLLQRPSQITALQRGLKISDITADDCGVEADWIDAAEDVVVYRAADGIKELFE